MLPGVAEPGGSRPAGETKPRVPLSGGPPGEAVVEAARGLVAERLVRTPLVEEDEEAADGDAGLGEGVVGVEVDLLVLEGAPEPLDEDVVEVAAPTLRRIGRVAYHGEICTLAYATVRIR